MAKHRTKTHETPQAAGHLEQPELHRSEKPTEKQGPLPNPDQNPSRGKGEVRLPSQDTGEEKEILKKPA